MMHRSRSIRWSLFGLILMAGLVAPLGCGDKASNAPPAAEDKPTIKSKDSMDFYKKSKNIPSNPAKR